MTQRFRRSFTPLTSPTTKTCAPGPECPCCAAIRHARQSALFDPLPGLCSPLTPGVQLVNVGHSDDGRDVRVDLSEDWARMFGQLTGMGLGLVMTRNAAAILGRSMPYPALNITTGGSKGAGGDGGLWLDFRQLGAARAVHMRRETGHMFGVEFADEAGHVVHRFTLTPQSEMDEFFAWVRLHQACTAHPPARWLDEEEPPLQDAAETMRQCDGGALVSVVAACLDRAVPLRVTVRGAAATQRAEFVPKMLRPSAEWWFASDDVTGLHFQPDLVTNVSIEQQPRDEGEGRTALRAMVEDGSTALILEAACGAA
jgi:putative heme degradation protein